MTTQRIESWKSIIPTLGDSYKEILIAIDQMNGNATLYELAMKLKKEMHLISGRVTELRDKKIVKDTGMTRKSPKSLRSQTVWTIDYDKINEFIEELNEREVAAQKQRDLSLR